MRPLATALLCALALVPTAASARGPSTAAERRRAVEATRSLERQPLAPGADERRAWLAAWIDAVPDITVTSCHGPLDPLADDEAEARHGRPLYLQSIFGMATFLVEHPALRRDWAAVQVAGIESTLRAYRALVASDPEARWPELDRLLAVQRRGGLARLVEDEMAGCGAPQPEAGVEI
jgi:hypothetical protein